MQSVLVKGMLLVVPVCHFAGSFLSLFLTMFYIGHVFQMADSVLSKNAGLAIPIDVPIPNVSHGEFTNGVHIL